MSDGGEFFHNRPHDGDLQLLVPGAEGMAISFVGREDTETVTAYVFDPESGTPQAPLFECTADRFEMLLEQASGALMDARDGGNNTADHAPTGPTGPDGGL